MNMLERLTSCAPLLGHLKGSHVFSDRKLRPMPFVWVENEQSIHVFTRNKDLTSLIAETILDELATWHRIVADATLQRHEGRVFEAIIKVNPCYER